jgi:hypothetical protein
MDDKTLKKLLAIGLLAAGAMYYWKTQKQEKFAPVAVENGNLTLTGTSDDSGIPTGWGKQHVEMASVPEPMPEPDPSAMPLPIDATKEPYAVAVVDAPLPEVPKDVAVVDGYDAPVEYTELTE